MNYSRYGYLGGYGRYNRAHSRGFKRDAARKRLRRKSRVYMDARTYLMIKDAHFYRDDFAIIAKLKQMANSAKSFISRNKGKIVAGLIAIAAIVAGAMTAYNKLGSYPDTSKAVRDLEDKRQKALAAYDAVDAQLKEAKREMAKNPPLSDEDRARAEMYKMDVFKANLSKLMRKILDTIKNKIKELLASGSQLASRAIGKQLPMPEMAGKKYLPRWETGEDRSTLLPGRGGYVSVDDPRTVLLNEEGSQARTRTRRTNRPAIA